MLKWFDKLIWSNTNLHYYQLTLDSLQYKIKVPFHLLATSLSSDLLDLELYLTQVAHALIIAATAFVPLERRRRGTRKKAGLRVQALKRQKNIIGFAVMCGLSLISPSLGSFSILQSIIRINFVTLSTFGKSIKSLSYPLISVIPLPIYGTTCLNRHPFQPLLKMLFLWTIESKIFPQFLQLILLLKTRSLNQNISAFS